MLLGYKEYIITADGYMKLYNELLKNHLPAQNIIEKKGKLYLKLSYEYCKTFEEICKNNDLEYEISNEKGLHKIAKNYRKRIGLLVGFAVMVGIIIYMSNVVVNIQVLSDDDKLCEKVRTALTNAGITEGSFIPEINYTVAERSVRQQLDDISWVGITRKGSTLFIDIVENIPQAESTVHSLPSNLVACENAVIDRIDKIGGQVRIKPGSGVTKGDIIVSGEIAVYESKWVDGKEVIKKKTNYNRCKGNVYGNFERKITFFQSYDNRERYNTGNTDKVRSFNFFTWNIPLYRKMPDGYFTSHTQKKKFKLFGLDTPLGITETELTEYDFKTKKLNKEQAAAVLEQKFYKYEQNFLKDYKIKNRKVTVKAVKNGVYQTVDYKLYGVISKETEFFINK